MTPLGRWPPLLVHALALAVGMLMLWIAYRVDPAFAALHLGMQLLVLAVAGLVARVLPVVALVLYGTCVILLIGVSTLHADNLNSYGPLLRESIDAIFQTTDREAISYVATFASPRFYLLAVCGLALVTGALVAVRSVKAPVVGSISLAALACVLLYAGRGLPLMIAETSRAYLATFEAFHANRDEVVASLGALRTDADHTVIVIMGESVARQHLGLYGYPRNTTPQLDRLQDELTVFTDVISSHSHTNESLSRALTFNDRSRIESMDSLPDLISVANASGIETWWLSNQNSIGVWDNHVAAISSQADHVVFHDPGVGMMRERRIFDEVLLDSLDMALAGKSAGPSLLFLHPMTAHFPYCAMVPEDFEAELDYANPPLDARFFGQWIGGLSQQMSEQDLIRYLSQINCYDRAISYLDTIAAGVIERARRLDGPVTVVITADHGEGVIYDSGHESRQHSHFHVEVPLLVWQNDEARSLQTGYSDRKGSLDDFSYLLADLLGIKGLTDVPERSLASPDYLPVPRRTLDQRVGYDEYDENADYVERARASLFALGRDTWQRVWAHRVNSALGLIEAKELFAGIEMDVVFSDGEFRVHHPPAPDTGLTLELQLMQDRGSGGRTLYWLDWKNANANNMGGALQRLERLDAQFGIKSRTLLETSSLNGPARVFTRRGWSVSYYLPTDRILACMNTCSETNLMALADSLWSDFDANSFSAISFDARLMPFVEDYMLGRILRDDVPAYSWQTQIDVSTPGAAAEIERVLDRPWLEALLVTMPSHFKI